MHYLKRAVLLFSLSLLSACGGGEPNQDTTLSLSQNRQAAKIELASSTLHLSKNRSSFTFQPSSTGYDLIDIANGDHIAVSTDTKRIRFADVSLALDLENSGKIFRLYQAAFNRQPDLPGLGFWLDAADNGASLVDIANHFIKSEEFQRLYGVAPSDNQFIYNLYNNVLHRQPEADGLRFWLAALLNGFSRAQVLVAFSESNENQLQTVNLTKDGILFAETGVTYRPVANAGKNQTGSVGTAILLDGTQSTDANGDSITYQWSVLRPDNIALPLSNAKNAKTSFVPEIPGVYTASLVVNDGTLSSEIIKITLQVFTPSPVSDTGIYKCSTISHALAVQLYLQGHTYLDRDRDGKPCEATDHQIETTITNPTPPVIPTVPNTGMCYVNGYRRKNGTYVSGYWRRC